MDAREKIRSQFADYIDELSGGRIPYTQALRLLQSFERQIEDLNRKDDNKCSSI